MESDATGTSSLREEALARALAAAHDALAAKIALIEAEQAAGTLSRDLAAGQVVYDRDCALARVAADTGWHTWAGVGGILYARRERSSPPKVVRAATIEALRGAIQALKTGCDESPLMARIWCRAAEKSGARSCRGASHTPPGGAPRSLTSRRMTRCAT